MEIKVAAIEYHRNGVCGDGFYTVRFRAPEVEREFKPNLDGEFLAVMPGVYASDDPAQRKFACEVECYVVFLPEPERNWRGDHFSDAVRDAIREANRARDEANETLRSSPSLPAGGAR